ncbi:MAG: RNA-binding domain-containing protein [Candidatus Nanoarchaeia archaeon]
MKLANHIHFRVFCTPEEEKEKIRTAFLSLIGYSKEELSLEKIKYAETNAKGFSQKTIVIFEADLLKDRHCNKFLKNFKEKLTVEDRKLLVEQVNRLDDNLNFFVRLDKDSLFEEKYVLTDSGNCFHITMNIEAHPRRKDVAHKIVKQIFGAD